MFLIKGISKKTVTFLGSRVPWGIYNRLLGREVHGFLYHTVSNGLLPHIRHLYSYKNPCMFEKDILFLKANFELPTISDLLDCSRPKKGKSQLAFISFDDGLAECFSVVRPILIKHQVPCIFFITTKFIDNSILMWRHKISLCIDKVLSSNSTKFLPNWPEVDRNSPLLAKDIAQKLKSLSFSDEPLIDQLCQKLEINVEDYLHVQKPYMTEVEIKQLADDGFVIGAHTKKHQFLGDLSQDCIESEIVESCQIISQITGAKIVPFAFPFSGNKVNRPFLSSLKQRHPLVGHLFDTRGVRLDEPFIINRIAADTPPKLEKHPSNLPDLLRREYCSYLMSRGK